VGVPLRTPWVLSDLLIEKLWVTLGYPWVAWWLPIYI